MLLDKDKDKKKDKRADNDEKRTRKRDRNKKKEEKKVRNSSTDIKASSRKVERCVHKIDQLGDKVMFYDPYQMHARWIPCVATQ